ncbi:MerR family transcriptional regulator [Altererythrobacter xixiisoli]|uniref:MerR family transcriptional regulator n=1 Tax=Croceibacterium xixiisoli TaxID=1476466 RepID=A0A6I4TV38_9SPHN|nr:MerR family transcriptional regulator [Croceibacterium xixiisoli]
MRFDDGKDPGALRTIGELSQALDIRQHVLRYWEQQFPMLKPLKRSGGRRYYRPEDVTLVETINRLVNHEGYTLKGARQAIAAKSVSEAEAQAAPTAPMAEPAAVLAASILPELRQIRDRLARALAA